MDKNIIKIMTGCLVGTIVISSSAFTTKAATIDLDLPKAGITFALNEKYASNPETADSEIKKILEPSEYDNIAIARVTYYVNMRSEPNEESEILGKIYNNSAATILEEEGDWYLVKSGTVTGYIKAEYFVTGEEAEALANEVGTRIAKVNTTTLKVRNDASLDATVQTLVPIEEEMEVVEELEEWVKVKIDSDVLGFVSAEYVDLRTDFVQAESIEEEKARLAKEEAERKAAEEAARAADEAAKKKASKSSKSKSSTASSSSSATSGSRQAIVSYALQFVGNPYVWGGTSLTNGADCSGFTQSVFGDNGISISRTSRAQGSGGREVSLDSIQPGDLLFYSNGSSINHVAIYIGNGQVVHASTEKTGIKISNAYYRTPCKAVSYID
ncbi:NlpC/P60 family protein [Candidatus Galacturonibacter soehngenii]|uniref:SH3 domain-containing protein n=1 Tax=Candidatus Galacturonatibacter soehngenii TaxID=2307010 RepID=A0A7V7QHR6_9FIRM|nr:NlpC/P60 family protein [Candidatus Galacturonibacter soehngenii]KAB1434533.1 SH3 domain-containing protein [Candidatus Galacturonibacter soehngenii]MBA4688161.1 C40 family peptidase [Candidatus Galacturonibacter soehngenii]